MTNNDTAENLPTDADALRALVRSLMADLDALTSERNELTAERDELLRRIEHQQHLLLKLSRMQFGQKSERLPDDQLQLGLEDTEQAIARNSAEAEKRDPELRRQQTAKRRASRGALPAHLPRIEITLAPENTTCPCCHAAMALIGEDSSERLDVIPVQYRVIVTRRPKFACRACEGIVVQEPAPARLIEGGIPTEALVAHVAVARFADHQPLYRQAQMMSRQGVLLDRSTLAFWMGYAAAEVAPVVARLREIILSSAKLFADETIVPVLDPGRGRTKQGYVWAIARDDRPWGGHDPPAVVYTYAPGRAHHYAITLLGGYRGIVQCDGYGAYKRLAGSTGDDVTLAFCWSHLRREFYDLAKAGAPVATETLSRIAALYQIEAEIRGKDADYRLAVRQVKSRPLVEDLRTWFEWQLPRLPGRGPTAEAIRYALNHWNGLEQFVADGRIELDTNSIERAMKPIILSRKNSLFAGSDAGGANWACMASLIETCWCGRSPYGMAMCQDETVADLWRRPSVEQIIRIGLDTSKHVFQLHGVNAAEQPVLRKKLRRTEMMTFFEKQPPTVVAIEACGASHHLARLLTSYGHEVKLIAPQLVKPYVKRGKNDAADADALCEAMSRPTMRFVPMKTAEEQAALMLVGVRDRLIRTRTQLVNAIRGYAAEFGLIAARGHCKIEPLIERIKVDQAIPTLARELFASQANEYRQLEDQLDKVQAKLTDWHRGNECSRRLAQIPGVGPIGASLLTMKTPAPAHFASGRHFAAWIGLTPKDHSTGGKTRLGVITRAGDEILRSVLVVGATALLRHVRDRRGKNALPWLIELLKRRPPKLVAVAVANKIARIAWKLMVTGERYRAVARPPVPAEAA